MPQNEREVAEVIAALDRLQRHEVITMEEALDAARLITGDPTFAFPPPAPPEERNHDAPPAHAGPTEGAPTPPAPDNPA